MESIKIIPGEQVRDRITRRAEIEDGPVVKVLGIAHHGKPLKVERVGVVYAAVGGRWELWELELHGRLLKKDGTPGQVTATSHVVDPDFPHRPAERASRWMLDIVDRLRPAEGAPLYDPAPFEIDAPQED